MKKILTCTDGSAYSISVLDHAAWAATRCGSSVRILHTLPPVREQAELVNISGVMGMHTSATFMAELVDLEEKKNRVASERGQILLDKAARHLKEAGIEQIETTLEYGGLVETVTAMEKDADLVVIGKRGESAGFAKLHLGSNLERVIRASTRPVLVASREFHPIRSVVIAYDGSATMDKAVHFVCESPLFKDISCRLIHVGDKATAELEEATARLLAARLDATTESLSGIPEVVVSDAVARHGADLLVMGAYGHSRLRQLLIGSTTTALIQRSKIPVLVFR